ncbi:Nuclear elongation and deformation protein 1 [Escovopsis weberi]|uniref:Nuclear elongation and deformation protein 1 n=1 Tax=Escovopsis weberi TaxID=150374 RepID=A0A0M8N1A3_ESCWE|nr:Nuclear elongation and deformation protein 1 [Escovopsis weberi]
MQYVRNLSDSVSTAWNSINPATLSGAIDVIVVEREDGTLACSPFHVRFGKFSLLRPSEKKVEFKVNGEKQDYSMKLGEGGEAFFVFETSDSIPESMQTSPLVSPVSSPPLGPEESTNGLQDPDLLDLDGEPVQMRRATTAIVQTSTDENGMLTPLSASPNPSTKGPISGGDWAARLNRPRSDDLLRQSARASRKEEAPADGESPPASVRSQSPPPLGPKEAIERAIALSKGLSAVNIPTHITETGDLMLDMTGFKSSEDDMIRAELLARNILSEEMDGNYDIGALFGFDEEGNLWVYSSEDAKQAAMSKTIESSLQAHRQAVAADAVSDPGYQSDGSDVTAAPLRTSHRRAESDAGLGLQTPPLSPLGATPTTAKSYAKTLRLTSEQLKDLNLKPGQNTMSFTVNRATCSANLYLWKYSTPVVISDIDGTITKSDALGHVLNMIGRDWTHSGIAKLYSDIALNGYNIMYLTSRSVGQADTTRAYLYNIAQEGFKMPPGPTILSPDRTMAALRREVYLRKPHVFKMATLRDIRNLYGPDGGPFYAGFGNRLTDQISYRTVDVPRTRIFTINSNSEVSLDLLSLNKLKMTYVNINEVVDHYFPPIDTLVRGGREEYTDFMYWRDDPLQVDDFSASEDEDDRGSMYTDDEEEEMNDALADSYISNHTAEEDEDYEEEDDEEYDDDAGDEMDADDEAIKGEKTLIQDGPVVEDVPAELITGVGHLSVTAK